MTTGDFLTMYEAFASTVATHGDEVALREPGARSYTWSEWSHLVDQHRAALHQIGIGAGSTVALLLDGGLDTYVFDMAVVSAGGTAFSIYSTSAVPQITHQLNVSGSSLLIAQTPHAADARAAIEALGRPCELWVVDSSDAPVFAADPVPPVDSRPDDVATLIFTSGTTGSPKAAEITHRNVMSAIHSSQLMVPLKPGCRLISYLPPAHIADRVLAYYYSLTTGAVITFLPSPRELVAGLPDARPEILLCVPRTWDVLKQVATQVGRELVPDGFDAALREGIERVRAGDRTMGEAQNEIFSAVRERLGIQDVAFAMSGSAPIPVETLEFFAAMGVWICEGYGLSETTGISVINRADSQRIGTIGLAAPTMELKLAEDGELLIRGPLDMRGYRGNPEATAEAIEPDGWFHSGDLASIDDEGFVRIVGRKKEIIITSSGKNVSPTQIERAILPHSDLIGSLVCVGDGRPHLTALVTINLDTLARAIPELVGVDGETIARDRRVIDEIQAAVDAGNAKLSNAEKVRAFTVLPDQWLPGSPEMTDTLKLRRAAITSRYEAEIERMYALNGQFA